ncbi:MAG: hypothetical protein E7051_05070 [Lentisphaerae bacterium]|nr:hypothetical protein [Lentisphaerota bacterium]
MPAVWLNKKTLKFFSILFALAFQYSESSIFLRLLATHFNSQCFLDLILLPACHYSIFYQYKRTGCNPACRSTQVNSATSNEHWSSALCNEQISQQIETLDKEIAAHTLEQNALNQLIQKFQQLEFFTGNLEKCCEDEKVLTQDELNFAVLKKRFEDGKKVLDADNKYRPYKQLSDQLAAAVTALQKNEQLLQEQEKIYSENKQNLETASANAEKYEKEFGELAKLFAAVNELDTIIRTLDSSVSAAEKSRRSELRNTLNCRRKLAETNCQLTELEKNHSEAIAYLANHANDGELPAIQKICEEWLKNYKAYSSELTECQKQKNNIQKELAVFQKVIAEKEEILAREVENFEKISADEIIAKRRIDDALAGTAKAQWQELYNAHNQLYQQTLLCKSLEEHRKQLQDGKECPLCGAKEHPFAIGNIPEPEKEFEKLQELNKRLADIDKAEKALQKVSDMLKDCNNAKLQVQSIIEQQKIQLDNKQQSEKELIQREQKLQNDLVQTAKNIDEALAPFGLTWDKKTYTLSKEFALRVKKYSEFQSAAAIFNETKNELQNIILRLRTEQKSLLENCRNLKQNWKAEVAKYAENKAQRAKLFGDKNPAEEARKAEEIRTNFATAREKAQQTFTEISTKRSNTVENIQKLKVNISELNEQIITARESFNFACKTAGVTEEEFHTFVLTAEEMTELSAADANLKSRRKQLIETRENCEKEIKTLSEFLAGKKSKEEISAELTAVSEQLLEKNQFVGGLRQRIRQNDENKEKMAEQHAKLLEQKKAMELWNKLYDLIGVKDRFQRFAQGITLEHLLVLANLELEKLSGRYRLLRSKTEELGIDVADKDQGDEIRGCKTLSGGERFLVSLALALGLAQMAGEKIRVDSLFLDEGFGTLDAETLDTALDALNSLRSRGKLVGVISHVAAFSEKIPCIIEVNKSGGGRSTLQGPGVKAL